MFTSVQRQEVLEKLVDMFKERDEIAIKMGIEKT